MKKTILVVLAVSALFLFLCNQAFADKKNLLNKTRHTPLKHYDLLHKVAPEIIKESIKDKTATITTIKIFKEGRETIREGVLSQEAAGCASIKTPGSKTMDIHFFIGTAESDTEKKSLIITFSRMADLMESDPSGDCMKSLINVFLNDYKRLKKKEEEKK